MFDDLSDLYQEVILDHCKNPRNFREMPAATCSAQGHNPLCGDQLKLFLTVDGDRIREASFVGSGCCISKASASLLTESVKGKTRADETGFPDPISVHGQKELPTGPRTADCALAPSRWPPAFPGNCAGSCGAPGSPPDKDR